MQRNGTNVLYVSVIKKKTNTYKLENSRGKKIFCSLQFKIQKMELIL